MTFCFAGGNVDFEQSRGIYIETGRHPQRLDYRA